MLLLSCGRTRSHGRDGDLLGAGAGERETERGGSSSTVKRQVTRLMSRGHPAIGRAQRQMGFSKEKRITVSCVSRRRRRGARSAGPSPRGTQTGENLC